MSLDDVLLIPATGHALAAPYWTNGYPMLTADEQHRLFYAGASCCSLPQGKPPTNHFGVSMSSVEVEDVLYRLFGMTQLRERALAFAHSAVGKVGFEKIDDRDGIADVVAIGNGAEPALRLLRSQAAGCLLGGVNLHDRPEHSRRFRNLILIAPDLDDDVFCIADKPYGIGAMALEMVQRVSVLYSQHDTALDGAAGLRKRPRLGRVGPSEGRDSRVQKVDVTNLVEHRADLCYGALCSFGVHGLIQRLLRGADMAAAIPTFPITEPTK